MITMNIFIVIIIITCFPAASAVSTIKVGDQLNLTSQLVSPGGRFTLGFFTIRETGSTYLGIWYTSDSSSTKVWVANRSNPIMSNSSVLMIDPETGNLIIATGGETLVNISDNQSGSKHNLIATLQDIGDFQLKNENDNRLLWRSFDYPANVLLPGMKVGLDLRRRHKWELTSWLTDKIPDLGAFTLGCVWHPNSKLLKLSIRHRGIDYWEYPQENYKWGRAHGYNISYYYNNTELQMYLSYSSKFTSGTPMWILTPNGQVLDGETSSQLLGSHEFCYGSYSEDGCLNIVNNTPFCRSGSHDRFTTLNGEFTGAVLSSDNNSSLSTSDCMRRCWDDCACLAFNSRDNGVGCDIWTGTKNVKFLVNPKGTSVQKYVLVSPNKGIAKIVIWGPVVSGFFLLLLCLGLLWYLKNRKLQREEEREKDEYRHLLELMDLSDTKRGGRKGSDMVVFSFADIVTATNDFSDENKLGQGGVGIVYKGRLGVYKDEREVAIKRLSRTSGKGLVEFKNELILVAKLQHKNLVKVLGCCIHGEEHMIITEYMPNKCLDSVLFDETRKALLDWPKRWNIIEGIAQGLLYLHKYSRLQVIHRDLKASNVLLDESMNPKISDFGMARILEKDETEVITKRVAGTTGYMSPEYAMDGTFSVKSDVFSFGVLILEIVSGRRNTRFSHLDKTINLIGYAWELWQQGDSLQLQDPTLVGSCAEHQLSRIIDVALLCVQQNVGDRPVMSDVMLMLINDAMLLPVPKRPAFM